MLRYDILHKRFGKQSQLVFFTGAGISAESGLSTFRELDGYWSKYDPMKLASAEGFRADPELVLEWYAARRKKAVEAEPNLGHLAITHFQKLFSNSVVITQNVDGLHAQAGNSQILELHGNIHQQKCFKCGTEAKSKDMGRAFLNYCECGGLYRPAVVWFGESLPVSTLSEAFSAARHCDILITVGTSNQVYPAAQLPFEAQQSGAYVIEINPEATPFSAKADLSLREPAGKALPKLYEEFYAALS